VGAKGPAVDWAGGPPSGGTAPLRIGPTYRHPDAAGYRAPGGAWDVPPLDEVLSVPVTSGPAVVDGASRLNAATFASLSDAVAGGLRRLGVRRGDVVAWQLPNWWEAMVLFRACWRAGAVAAPFHHQFGTAEVARLVEVVEPKVQLAGPGLPLAEADGVIGVRQGDGRFDELLAAPGLGHNAGRPTDLAVVIFTTGSTGEPKAALHTQRGLAYKALGVRQAHGLGADDAVLMPSPLAHVSGLLSAVLVPGAAGMRAVLMEKWDPEAGLRLVAGERVSYMIGPPTIFTAMMATPGYREQVDSLRVVSCGSMGVTPEFVAEATEALGAFVKRTYGSTEAPTVTTCPHDDDRAKAAVTDGRSFGEAVVRIVDPQTGRTERAGHTGEVWLRGPELFCGYVEAEQTKASVHRGWFRTGDLGSLDEDGWLTIGGRIKELIIRAGENIASAEVERVLETHPAVRQAVVVGRPDERLGERVVAFVVADPVLSLDECRRWCAERGMARFKTPELVVNVDEIPALGIGKPDRAALRARAAASVLPV